MEVVASREVEPVVSGVLPLWMTRCWTQRLSVEHSWISSVYLVGLCVVVDCWSFDLMKLVQFDLHW